MRYPYGLFLRLSENDRRVLELMSKYTGLPKATIVRMALKEFYLKSLEEDMPKSLRRELLYLKVNEKIREIKRFRWLGHQLRKVREVRAELDKLVRDYEDARAEFERTKRMYVEAGLGEDEARRMAVRWLKRNNPSVLYRLEETDQQLLKRIDELKRREMELENLIRELERLEIEG